MVPRIEAYNKVNDDPIAGVGIVTLGRFDHFVEIWSPDYRLAFKFGQEKLEDAEEARARISNMIEYSILLKVERSRTLHSAEFCSDSGQLRKRLNSFRGRGYKFTYFHREAEIDLEEAISTLDFVNN